MVGWLHQLNGHEFEQTPGSGDGQGSLVCCSPWGRKESHMTEHLNRTETIRSSDAMKNKTKQINKNVKFTKGIARVKLSKSGNHLKPSHLFKPDYLPLYRLSTLRNH